MRIKKGFELRDVCGEKVIVASGLENIDFSKIISLNESAAYLWEKLQGADFSVQDAADRLTEAYDVSSETALTDAGELLARWRELGIVE